MNDKNIFWILPVILLVLALFPMPSGYYTLLRLIVFICSIYFVFKYLEIRNETMTWIFGILAVIYNPIIPVYLYNKTLWAIINLITIAVFFNGKSVLQNGENSENSYIAYLKTVKDDLGERGIALILAFLFFLILIIFDI